MNEILGDIIQTIVQSGVSITLLFIVTRIMGKKQISQLTFFDYVIGISIGSLAADIAVGSGKEFFLGIGSIIVYTIFTLLLAYISIHSFKGRRLFEGTPTILIQNGKIIEKNLKVSKLDINDLLELCRIKNAFDISHVDFAILETNGEMSVQLKPDKQPLTPSDLNIPTQYKGLCTNLIIDGKIIALSLTKLGKDKDWLNDELKKYGINSPSEVLLASIDNYNNIYIDKKHNDPEIMTL